MLRTVLKGKIHRAVVTGTELKYDGSIAIDSDLLEAADIAVGELVQVVNINNGVRIETYTIAEEAGSGQVVMKGAAARCAEPGDEVIVISYAQVTEEELAAGTRPKVVSVGPGNKVAGVS
jgi:aspartate 1-decarboxylase